ncbi:MAG: hypothetical protein Q7V57_12280 [Actinomycetota bacterium]|nr:hypothetical protein [Actinomycetota bacterium]
MTMRRTLPVLVAALALASCSSTSPGADSTSSAATTSAVASTTSARPASTTTAAASTTTTTNPAAALELSSSGLGELLFGDDSEGVFATLTTILGEADEDTGWLDTAMEALACPGTEVRFVRWHDLTITFSDESPYATGSRHFAAYTYGPAAGDTIEPWGLATEAGLGVGDTVADLTEMYPDAVVHLADELSGPSFYIEEGLSGFLTGVDPIEELISFVGGYGCGE